MFYLSRSTCLDPINQNCAPAKDAQKSLSLFLWVCLELCWVRLLALTRSHKVETAATSVVYSSLLSKIRIYAEDLTIAATRGTIDFVSNELGEIFHKFSFFNWHGYMDSWTSCSGFLLPVASSRDGLGASKKVKITHFFQLIPTNRDLTYTTRQGTWVSCLALTGFAAFGKGVQLISMSICAETKQLSRLTSPSGILVTVWT